MQLFRFDAAIAARANDQTHVAPLAGDDSRVRVEVVYVPAGGVVSRSCGAEQELLAVVGVVDGSAAPTAASGT